MFRQQNHDALMMMQNIHSCYLAHKINIVLENIFRIVNKNQCKIS